MTPRRTIPASIKAAVAERQHGLDPDTGMVLLGTAELDHWVPLGLGGSNEPDNLIWRNKAQHKAKTRRDVKMIAKAKRLARKLSGDWPKRGRKLRSGAKLTGRGFDKRWKQPMRGRAYLKPETRT